MTDSCLITIACGRTTGMQGVDIARVLYEDLQDLDDLGLNGLMSLPPNPAWVACASTMSSMGYCGSRGNSVKLVLKTNLITT